MIYQNDASIVTENAFTHVIHKGKNHWKQKTPNHSYISTLPDSWENILTNQLLEQTFPIMQ